MKASPDQAQRSAPSLRQTHAPFNPVRGKLGSADIALSAAERARLECADTPEPTQCAHVFDIREQFSERRRRLSRGCRVELPAVDFATVDLPRIEAGAGSPQAEARSRRRADEGASEVGL